MSNDMRVGGLVSNIDTESIVKKLMSGAQLKLDSEKQKRQILEWKRESYRDINTKLLAVRNTLVDLKMPATFNAKTVTSSDEKTATATANGDAITGTYSIKVKQAAQRVSMSSAAAMGSSGDNGTIAKQFGLDEDAKIKFTLKGKDAEIAFDFAAGDASMDEIVDGINNQNTGINAFYDKATDRLYLMTSEFGSNAEITVKVDGGVDGTGSFLKDYLKLNVDYSSLNTGGPPATTHNISSSSTIAASPPAATSTLASLYSETETVPSNITFTLQGTGSKYDFTFSKTTTLASLVTGINDQTATTGITAAYDAGTGKFSLSSGGQLIVRADDKDFLGTKLKLSMDENKGTKAIIDYNDATNLEFESNNFTLNNINFKIDPNAVANTTVTLKIANDSEKALNKIKAFIEAYNAAVSQISTKLSENRTIENHSVKYMPLTDSEREVMSEEQIKLWEEKAKKGIMRNEDILRSTLTNLRSITNGIFKDKVADSNVADKDELVDYKDSKGKLITNYQYKSLSAIGITTGQYATNSSDNSKLFIPDEAKLKEALEKNPEDVEKLFTLTQTDITATTTQVINGQTYTRTLNYSVGIAASLYDTLTTSMAQIVDKAGSDTVSYDSSTLADDIYREDTLISKLLDRMDDMEDRYYAQFAAMETALQKLTEQGNALQQKFASSSSG